MLIFLSTRIVQKRFHRVVPGLVDWQILVDLHFFQIPICLNDLHGIGRTGKDDCDQIVRVQRNRPDQLVKFGCSRGRAESPLAAGAWAKAVADNSSQTTMSSPDRNCPLEKTKLERVVIIVTP